MKTSVVIAAYNGEMYLPEQLNSILNQSSPPDEVVVSDDRSVDQTRTVVGDFCRRFPDRVRLTVNPGHPGTDGNFQHAIGAATGEVIFLADQDDVWLPRRLEIMLREFQCATTPVGVFCDSHIVDDNLRALGFSHWQSRGFHRGAAEFTRQPGVFLKRVPASGHDMAFDVRLRSLLLPFPDLPNCYDTWIGLMLAALQCWRCAGSVPLTLFRRHRCSQTRSGMPLRSWSDRWQAARQSVADDTFDWYARLYAALLERLADRVDFDVAAQLRDRRKHSEARRDMKGRNLYRWKLIADELFSGRYFRYARSWQSIVQDLLLR